MKIINLLVIHSIITSYKLFNHGGSFCFYYGISLYLLWYEFTFYYGTSFLVIKAVTRFVDTGSLTSDNLQLQGRLYQFAMFRRRRVVIPRFLAVLPLSFFSTHRTHCIYPRE